MKTPAHDILNFVFSKIGETPSDNKLVEWASACETASISLFSTIKDIKIQGVALGERSALTAECIRKITGALDAVEHGELEAAVQEKKILQ